MGALNRLHMGEMSELASRTATLEELLIEQARINTKLLRMLQDGDTGAKVTTSNGTVTTVTHTDSDGTITAERETSAKNYIAAKEAYETAKAEYDHAQEIWEELDAFWNLCEAINDMYSQVTYGEQTAEKTITVYGTPYTFTLQEDGTYTGDDEDLSKTIDGVTYSFSWNGNGETNYESGNSGYETLDDTHAAVKKIVDAGEPTAPSYDEYGTTEADVKLVESGSYEISGADEIIDEAARGRVVINMFPGDLHPFKGHPHEPHEPHHHHHHHHGEHPPFPHAHPMPLPMLPHWLGYYYPPVPPPIFYPPMRAHWTYRS